MTSSHYGSNTIATAACVDTNFYVIYKNTDKGAGSFYTFPSTGSNKYSLGYSYANTGTITISAIGFIAGRKTGSPSATIPTKAYLYSVTGAGVPLAKIDSISLNIGAASYYYGTLATARTMTTNFALVFRNNSSVATDSISMYMTPAQTSTASTNNYGEGRGYVGASATQFYSTNSVFTSTVAPLNPTPDYEPAIFPVYSFNMSANYTVTPAAPRCIGTTVINTNTSTNTNVPESYMYNYVKYLKKWNVTVAGLDSVYIWGFSDGSGHFKSKNQNHVYAANGNYNDTLLYTFIPMSNAANCVDKKITTIHIGPGTLTLTPVSVTICPTAIASFTASGLSSFAWQGGQSAATATFSPASNTTYSVTGTDACGTSTAVVNVVVSSVVSISAISSIPTICAGSSSTLSVSGATSYTWSPSASLSSANGSTVTATPTGNTTYTITGVSSCGTATTTLVQNVTPNPTVTVVSSTTAVCSGSSATLTASGATTYTWMPAGGGSAAATVNPSTSTTYTVQGTTASCSSTKTVALTVNPSPTVTAISSSSAICAGASVTLTANTNGVNTLWSNGASTAATVVTPTSTTTYSVGVANASFCTATANVMVTVNTCAGIEELSGSAISVYPNPNTGVLNISVSSALANNSTVEIYDAIGKLMISQNLSNEQNAINTSSLANGVYIYKIVNSTKSVKIGRIVKQ